jgi:hypothetical protein
VSRVGLSRSEGLCHVGRWARVPNAMRIGRRYGPLYLAVALLTMSCTAQLRSTAATDRARQSQPNDPPGHGSTTGPGLPSTCGSMGAMVVTGDGRRIDLLGCSSSAFQRPLVRIHAKVGDPLSLETQAGLPVTNLRVRPQAIALTVGAIVVALAPGRATVSGRSRLCKPDRHDRGDQCRVFEIVIDA